MFCSTYSLCGRPARYVLNCYAIRDKWRILEKTQESLGLGAVFCRGLRVLCFCLQDATKSLPLREYKKNWYLELKKWKMKDCDVYNTPQSKSSSANMLLLLQHCRFSSSAQDETELECRDLTVWSGVAGSH